jgi:cytochrome c-type biogenesis protein CcsB
MNDAGWEALGNQAIAAAGALYFLALLAHLVEWSALRKVPAGRQAAVPVGAGVAAEPSPELSPGRVEPEGVGRVAMFGRLGVLLTGLAVAVHLVGLVGRGLAADPDRVPWGNMYEFTITGTFMVAAGYVVLVRRFEWRWLAPVVLGVVLTLLMVAVLWLYTPVGPLTEALDSPWLVIHVVSAVLATAVFTLGGVLSVIYLLKERRPDTSTGYLSRVPSLARLDQMAYRLHAFAFPVWTFAVLITGPIWAHQAWSSYWNWDPKEVWAFITWVVYAAYLHARSTAGWRGRRAAYLALLGTATLWYSFIGVNYFSSTSQHSYAVGAVVVGPPTVGQVSVSS